MLKNLAQLCGITDHCSSVSMCVIQYGIEFAAVHVLPLLTPLLIAQRLNVQQFAKYMLFVKDILRYYIYMSLNSFIYLVCFHLNVMLRPLKSLA